MTMIMPISRSSSGLMAQVRGLGRDAEAHCGAGTRLYKRRLTRGVNAPCPSPASASAVNRASCAAWKWFGPDDLRSFGHRSRAKQMGFAREDWAGKPVIAILNTWSDLSTCHTHFRQRAEQVKRGVWQAGGFPVELPVMSLSESFMKPTSMFYRNLAAMEVEETLRCHPIDGAVLMGGCDKTVPALVMGAASADLPAIFLPAGPMLKGNFAGKTLGSGTDAWKYWAERCAGNLCDEDWLAIEDGIARSPGTCMTMGTASTMAAITETLGLTLSGASSIPAVHSAHERMASACGRRAVELVWEDLRPSDILTADAFDNAITIDMALSGSTNAIIHLIAMAGRAGVKLDLDLFDAISRRTPVLANLRPAGKYLMEDFHDAGGLPAVLWRIRDLLKLGCLTVGGRTLGDDIRDAPVHNQEVILPRAAALAERRHLRPARQPRAPGRGDQLDARHVQLEPLGQRAHSPGRTRAVAACVAG